MREGLVGFSHTMDFIALLNGTAAVFSGVEQFAGEALRHRLFGTTLSRFTEPAHRESEATNGTDFDRDLIVGATNAAGLNFHQRTDVVDGVVEHFNSALAGLFFDLRKGTVDDAFRNRLLPSSMITLMNFVISTLPYLGSGRISRFGTSRRRGILIPLSYLQSCMLLKMKCCEMHA